MCDFNKEFKTEVFPCGRCAGTCMHECTKCSGLGYLDPDNMSDSILANRIRAYIARTGRIPGCTSCGGSLSENGRNGRRGTGRIRCMCGDGTQSLTYSTSGVHWHAGIDNMCVYCGRYPGSE